MRVKRLSVLGGTLLLVAGLLAVPAGAQRVADQAKDPGFAPNAEMAPRPGVVGRVTVTDGLVTIEPAVEFDRARLTVKRIGEGIVFTRNYTAGGTMTWAMVDDAGQALGDGQYGYEFLLVKSPVRNGKGAIVKAFHPMVANGTFEIRGGALVAPEAEGAAGGGRLGRATAPLGRVVAPDVTVNDDLIVEGSACTSSSSACADGEVFLMGDTTVEFKAKDSNPGIGFEDTSAGSNDWTIRNANGALFFTDQTAGNAPFKIEEAAPDNQLVLDATGAVGFGTAAPATALHVVSGKNVFMRIEDTTADETWDFGTNTGGDFAFILQATNNAGATTGTKFVIEPSGEVGIGTASPVGNLHIFGPQDQDIFNAVGPIPGIGGNALNFGYSGSTFGIGSGFFNVRPEGVAPNPALYFATGDVDRMMIDNQGFLGVHLDGSLGPGFNPAHPIHSQTSGAHLTAGGIWTNASSRDLKDGIAPLDADAALQALAKLEPVNFHYKLEPEDAHVGFISEEVPELVATPDRKTLSPMDIVAVLTRVVQEQQRTAVEQQRTIAALAARVEELEASKVD